jgi:hypothetical protein
MTEADWLTATDPMPVLEYLRDKSSDRKLRLLGVACARASWNRLEDDRSRRAVETAELYADGEVDASVLETVNDGAWDVRDELWDANPASDDDRLWLAEGAGIITSEDGWWTRLFSRNRMLEEYPFRLPMPAHCDLARCLFGNPFRPVAFDPAWRGESAAALATGIYAERAFDRLPILADALEEAGCDHPDVLTHCRNPGIHARGCWVIDAILGNG